MAVYSCARIENKTNIKIEDKIERKKTKNAQKLQWYLKKERKEIACAFELSTKSRYDRVGKVMYWRFRKCIGCVQENVWNLW